MNDEPTLQTITRMALCVSVHQGGLGLLAVGQVTWLQAVLYQVR
jgi:hypothetical protein